jgi:hypothetical protein
MDVTSGGPENATGPARPETAGKAAGTGMAGGVPQPGHLGR